MAEKKFYQYYDIVRTFSICLVIMGHSCNSWMKWDQPITNFSTAFIHLVYCICSMCNVTFFIISGALLLKSKKNTSPKAVLKGRVPRVLIPALFWGLIYVAYFATDCFTARPNAYRLGLAIDMIKNCLSVPWSSHLWFIYTIITFFPSHSCRYGISTASSSISCLASSASLSFSAGYRTACIASLASLTESS